MSYSRRPVTCSYHVVLTSACNLLVPCRTHVGLLTLAVCVQLVLLVSCMHMIYKRCGAMCHASTFACSSCVHTFLPNTLPLALRCCATPGCRYCKPRVGSSSESGYRQRVATAQRTTRSACWSGMLKLKSLSGSTRSLSTTGEPPAILIVANRLSARDRTMRGLP
jgi:hypothetical protein